MQMVHEFIAKQMDVLDIPYEFGEWTQDVIYPYGVGEVIEPESDTEDGKEEPSVKLTFWHRGQYIALEEIKNKIKKHFNPINGLRAKTDSGAIAVFFSGAMYIPTNEAELKRLEITLRVMEWEGER